MTFGVCSILIRCLPVVMGGKVPKPISVGYFCILHVGLGEARTRIRAEPVVVHTFNPSTPEAEAGGSLGVQGQPGLQSELQDSQGCETLS